MEGRAVEIFGDKDFWRNFDWCKSFEDTYGGIEGSNLLSYSVLGQGGESDHPDQTAMVLVRCFIQRSE